MLKLLKKLWHFLEKKRKRQFFGLIFLTIITSFAEMISLGAIFPFITVLTNPEQVYEIPFLGEILISNGMEKGDELIIPLATVFALAALVAGLMRLFLLKVSVLISNATGADLSINVFERTLYQPYSTHISRSSSEVISGITQKVNAATNVLISVVTVITNSFLFFCSRALSSGVEGGSPNSHIGVQKVVPSLAFCLGIDMKPLHVSHSIKLLLSNS